MQGYRLKRAADNKAWHIVTEKDDKALCGHTADWDPAYTTALSYDQLCMIYNYGWLCYNCETAAEGRYLLETLMEI